MLAGHLIFKEKSPRSKALLSWAWMKVRPGLPSPSLCFQLSSDLLVYGELPREHSQEAHSIHRR